MVNNIRTEICLPCLSLDEDELQTGLAASLRTLLTVIEDTDRCPVRLLFELHSCNSQVVDLGKKIAATGTIVSAEFEEFNL